MSVGTAPGLFDATTLVRHAAGELPPIAGSPAGGRPESARAVGVRAAGELRAREVRAGHPSAGRGSVGRGSLPPQSAPRMSPARPGPPLPQAARDLLIDASRGLGRAIRASNPADRYAAAHLAALRAAAAVLAARARPVRGRRGSAWELITKVAPEFSEWAAFFAAGSAKRQAAEAGLHRLVTAREADDMLRQVSAFIDLVEESLSPA
ncbi:SAV_6107 family HEPN domain-containing protein [Nakamurella sp. GG22]